jgi:DNA segregation ATPase FtsK/SpoIIIE-like protein
MLLMRPDAGKLARVQGCYVADDEIGGVVAFWKKHAASQQAAGQPVAAPPPWNGILDQLDDDEELLQRGHRHAGGNAHVQHEYAAAPPQHRLKPA